MKVTVKRNDLLSELSHITSIVEKSTKLPILSHVLVDARGESQNLVLAGSDLTVSIKTTCPAVIEKPGALALPARELTDMIRFMPENAEIEIRSEDSERVIVSFGRSRSRIVCLPVDTFPTISGFDGRYIEIPGDILRKMIQMTIFSITQEQVRFTLSGILLIINKNFIKMVSTDGHRMAYVESTKAFEDIENEIKILIPKKTVSELSKILQKDHLVVQFAHDENHIYFKIDNRLMVSRLLAGQFPNYELVIPRNLHNRLQLKTAELRAIINRLNVMADEVSKRIVFRLEDGRMLLRSENVKKGEAEETLEVDYQGEKVEMGFNCQYLLEFLAVAETPEVIFEFTNDEYAGLFRPVGELDYTYKYIVMPMSV